jgi:hypothetical protein
VYRTILNYAENLVMDSRIVVGVKLSVTVILKSVMPWLDDCCSMPILTLRKEVLTKIVFEPFFDMGVLILGCTTHFLLHEILKTGSHGRQYLAESRRLAST